MTKTISNLLAKRPWIANIDDERNLDNGIIVSLVNGWCFVEDPGCGVRGFDTIAEVKEATVKSSVYPTN